ncbi:hypothetical protein [Vibrio crassostreae]|uniref:hypothetical protein n=1 Tax=Vibrio crassostreae TaxID=246167 RepID=UPI001B304297|nr:hypothetical protein [Vibrio crassostreae]
MSLDTYKATNFFIEHGGISELADLDKIQGAPFPFEVATGRSEALYITCERTRFYPNVQFTAWGRMVLSKCTSKSTDDKIKHLMESQKELVNCE